MYNPILPADTFLPDAEPRIFHGRIYLYGSHDLAGDKARCRGDYEVWSASTEEFLDAVDNGGPSPFRRDGISYRRTDDPFLRDVIEKGKENFGNSALYAPDVTEIDGRYYLFYGVAMSGAGLRVAVSDRPEGPFDYLGQIRYPDGTPLGKNKPVMQPNPLKKHFGFHLKNYPYDPSVIVEDGHLYLFFGAGHCYVAEISMEDKLTLVNNERWQGCHSGELLPSVFSFPDHPGISAQDGWFYVNGPSVRKIGARFYLSYYARNRANGSAMCYSVADRIEGPYRYGGVIVSLGNARTVYGGKVCAPGGNTHGGIAEIDGRYFQFYHRHTGDPDSAARQCCVQEIRFEDGRFLTAEFKSSVGLGRDLRAEGEYPAYIACSLTDAGGKYSKKAPYFALLNEGGVNRQAVTRLQHEGQAGFKYFVFDNRPHRLAVKLGKTCPGSLEVRLDSPDGPPAAVCGLDGSEKETAAVDLPRIGGRHAVYLKLKGQSRESVLESLTFEVLQDPE